MNLFYESLPTSVMVSGRLVRIRTDFRDYISLLDMIKDKDVKSVDKRLILSEYFLDDVEISHPAIDALCDFMSADFSDGEASQTGTVRKKNLFPFPSIIPIYYQHFCVITVLT